MRKSLLSKIKGLFITALVAGAVLSCEDEKPEIILPPDPDPVEPAQCNALTLLSGSISAYQQDSLATVRFKTNPWNLLNNQDVEFSITDMEGKANNDLFTIYNKSFMPDSTWRVQLYIKSPSGDDVDLKINLATPDTLMWTKVTFRKIDLYMLSVRTCSMTGSESLMKYDSKTGTYSHTYKGVTDLSQQQFRFEYSGDKITVNDSIILVDDQFNVLDVRKPLTVSIWRDDARRDYVLDYKMSGTGLPVVCINTYGKSVTSRSKWVDGNNMYIMNPDGTIDYEGTLSLKGRGNQTWSDFSKKPYAIRLDEKAKILGMHKHKRWALLANTKDRTLMRNDVSLWISKQTRLPYTVSGEFVELVWNGVHKGNYYLCEQIRIDNHRVDIHKPNLDDPEKGGILMEIDALLDYKNSSKNNEKAKWADKSDEIGFWSTGASNRYKLPYIFKDPDEDEEGNLLSKSSPTYTYMENYVKKMEDAIYNARTNDDWMNYLDISTAVDFALIQEITMNHDAYNTWPENGPHSTFLYKDSCGLLCFGPVWDFDYHTYTLYNDFEYGNTTWDNTQNPRIQQWEVLKMDSKGSSGGWGGGSNNKYYFSDLAKRSSKFNDLLQERWAEYKEVWENGFEEYVDQMADKIGTSEVYNQQIWGYPSRQNGDWQLSFDGAVQAMKDAFYLRIDWIDAHISELYNP
jgi:hypothetical protein